MIQEEEKEEEKIFKKVRDNSPIQCQSCAFLSDKALEMNLLRTL